MNLIILVICVFCFNNIKGEEKPPVDDVIIEISTGRIKGRKTETVDQKKTYYAFQGIPYAQPPIGDLRFRPPVPANKWENILESQYDEKQCLQQFTPKGSEDCLYINVFAPKQIDTTLLPVMVWIYGGYFFKGNSTIGKFGPDYFLEEDVIVVTFNYRLGIFGFLSTDDSASPGNYGLKDQILALKWVQNNIERFGGDPNKVTLFGQSAGSASVSYLLQTPLTENLFHRAIMQSGTTLNLWALSRQARKLAFQVGKAFDIDTTNSTVLVEALRKIRAGTLQTVSASTNLVQTVLSNPRDGLIFAPTVEPTLEGAVVVDQSYEKLKIGDFHRVPCMVGFNSEEGIPVKEIIDSIRPYLFTYDIFFSRLVPIDMHLQSFWVKKIVSLAIRKKYFGLLPIGFSNQSIVQFVTDDQFVRPIHEYVSLLVKFVPVFYYKFSYEGPLGVDGDNRTYKGVGHNEELSYLWNRDTNIKDPSKSDLLTRKRLVKLWTNFAKTSDPTPNDDPLLQNIHWPSADFRNIVYLDIGNNLKLESNMDNYNIDFWKNLYTTFAIPPFDTY